MKFWATLLLLIGAAGVSLRADPVLDLPVTTEDGRSVHFLSDVVAGKTAFINFIYTDCGGMCPMQGRNFAVLSHALRDRLAKDVVLISISIAPEVDTPEKLARWKARYSPAAGWTCVTGDPATIRQLLKSLIGDISPQAGHNATAVVMYPGTQKIEQFSSMSGPGEFVRRLDPAVR